MASRENEDLKYKGRKLWEALKSDPVDLKTLRDLLLNGAPANFREPDSKTNRTPLHFVVWERDGDEDIMDMLLERGADTNLGDWFDLTPLHLAAEKGNLQAVKTLLRNPHSPADCDKRNRENETALQIAKKKEHDHVISYLLKCRQNTVYSDGGSHVEVSTKSGSVKVFGENVNVMVGDNSKMNLNNS